ncbi:MAG: L,D-transpeptidase family protein [Prevotella sp.]|nr:L,D-transpeptidase family protein [Prevotella sp.]
MRLRMLAAILTISSAIMLTTSCFNGGNAAKKGQLLEVYDVHGCEATARLTVNGKVLFTTSVYIGKNGIGKEGEGDAKTPIGKMHVLKAFGVKPNPGTSIPYIDVTTSIYACDDQCEYYNQIIDTAMVHHKCGGEDMFHTVPEYYYGIATDFNKDCVWPKGSNIFIHCKGHKTWTGGCIALDEERMVELLKNSDQSLVITVSE